MRLLHLVCFVMSVVMMTSCEKNNDVVSGEVVLVSFGPTGAKHGDTLRFFGNNLNKVTSIEFTGAGAAVAQAAFISQTSELILLKVPIQAEQGFVTLKVPEGDVVSKTRFNLEVMPTVTTITVQARPGENITLTGQYLNWVTRVTFADNKSVDTFISRSMTQLVVKIPLDARTGPLVLNYSGTKPEIMQTKDTVRVTLPVATSLSPNPIKHADNLTITGTNLDLARKVIFSGVATPVTTFVSQTATQLVVKVPGGSTKGKVIMEAASGVQTTSTADLDVLMPAITTMSPNPVTPGTNLTITGANLNLVTAVTFQNAAAVTTFVSQSATQIVVIVPTGILRGKVTLGVLNSSLTVQSNDVLEVAGAVPPPTLAFPLYKDEVSTNWNGWIGGGWGGTSDRNNTAPVREGTKAIRINYVGGYGSPLQLGGASINLAPYKTFHISVYGAPGSAGKTITIGINGVNGKFNIPVVEGKWNDYSIPLSTLTSETTLKEIWVQEYSGTGGFTVYVDALGLN